MILAEVVSCATHHEAGSGREAAGFGGVVRDASTLAPVADAAVTVMDGQVTLEKVTSDAKGLFRSSVREGKALHVRVESDRFAQGDAKVPADRSPLDVRLHRGTHVRGRVISAATGRSVPGATVTCVRAIDHEVGHAITDETGSFAIDHCGSMVAVRADGFAFETKIWGWAADGDQLEGVIALQPPNPVSGTVVDESGHPVADAQVLVIYEGVNPRLGATAWARSDATGRFALPPLSRSSRWFLAFRPSGPVGVTEHRIDGPTDVRVVLPAAGRIAGRVLRADRSPAAGARVLAGWYLPDAAASLFDSLRQEVLDDDGSPSRQLREDAWTDSNGAFRFDDLWGGAIYLRVSHPSGRADVYTRTGQDVVLTLSSSAGSVEGEIVGTNGELVDAGGDVSGQRETSPGRSLPEDATFNDEGEVRRGRFRIDGIAAGNWMLLFHVEPAASASTMVEPVHVEAGRTTTVKILAERNGLVKGRIVDAMTGAPVPNTCVDASYSTGPTRVNTFGTRAQLTPCDQPSDHDGRFVVEGVRGRVELQLYSGPGNWGHQPRSTFVDVPFGADVDIGDVPVQPAGRYFR